MALICSSNIDRTTQPRSYTYRMSKFIDTLMAWSLPMDSFYATDSSNIANAHAPSYLR